MVCLDVGTIKQASKMSNKVTSRMWTGENNGDCEGESGESHHSGHRFSESVLPDHREDANSSGASTPRGDLPQSPLGAFSQVEEKFQGKTLSDPGEESEGKPIHKIIHSKAEAWTQKKTLSWPWRTNDREGSEARNLLVAGPSRQNDQENESVSQNILSSVESNHATNNEAPGSWSSYFNVNSTSSASSCGSAGSCAVTNKTDVDTDCLDYEILWEDLTIREPIGEGSHVKLFTISILL